MTQTQSQTEPTVVVEDDRTGMSPKTLERAVLDHLFYTCSKDLPHATMHDLYRAMAHAVRDRLVHRWIHTMRAYREQDVKRAYYLSAEFLLGRALALGAGRGILVLFRRHGSSRIVLDRRQRPSSAPRPDAPAHRVTKVRL